MCPDRRPDVRSCGADCSESGVVLLSYLGIMPLLSVFGVFVLEAVVQLVVLVTVLGAVPLVVQRRWCG